MFGSCTHPPATPPSPIPASLAANNLRPKVGFDLLTNGLFTNSLDVNPVLWVWYWLATPCTWCRVWEGAVRPQCSPCLADGTRTRQVVPSPSWVPHLAGAGLAFHPWLGISAAVSALFGLCRINWKPGRLSYKKKHRWGTYTWSTNK